MAEVNNDQDYLEEYSQFFNDFITRMDPKDQLPVQANSRNVTDAELIGEIVYVTVKYLDQNYCPSTLQGPLTHMVLEQMKSMFKKQSEDSDGIELQDTTYDPLKLMQAVTNKVNEICTRYSDNSQLTLLPGPNPWIFTASGVGAKNTRRSMEDRYVILHDLNTIFGLDYDYPVNYYAVFDGHAGSTAATYCAAHLHHHLVQSLYYHTDPEQALNDAFLKTDSNFVEKEKNGSGTTAVCVLIIKKKMYIAWAGDSKVGLAKDVVYKNLVRSHRPNNQKESSRIISLGGFIIDGRTNGILGVTRAIGDYSLKPFVTADPEIRCVNLTEEDDYIILGSDGYWDFLTMQDTACHIYERILEGRDCESITKSLLNYAKSVGSDDNITVILVFLKPLSDIQNKYLALKLEKFVLTSQLDLDSNKFRKHWLVDPKELGINMDINRQINFGESDAPYWSIIDYNSTEIEREKTTSEPSSNKDYCENDQQQENGLSLKKTINETKEYDEEDTDGDLGPETDVDALDEPAAPVSHNNPFFIENQHPSNNGLIDDQIDGDILHEMVQQELQRTKVEDTEKLQTNDDPSVPEILSHTKPNRQVSDTDNVVDSEDSDDGWNFYRTDPNKEKDEGGDEVGADTLVASSNEKEIIEKDNNELDEVAVESNEVLEKETFGKCEDIGTEVSLGNNPTKEEEEEMDSQLNPNAAEFVPVSPPKQSDQSPSMAMNFTDFLACGSPMKQNPNMAVENLTLPSEQEFREGVATRPGEVDDKNYSNGREDNRNEHDFDDDKENLISEMSSTIANYADDSSENMFTTTAEFDENDEMESVKTNKEFEQLWNEPKVNLNVVHDLTKVDSEEEEEEEEDEDEDTTPLEQIIPMGDLVCFDRSSPVVPENNESNNPFLSNVEEEQLIEQTDKLLDLNSSPSLIEKEESKEICIENLIQDSHKLTLNLSESMQEFNGLERQLEPSPVIPDNQLVQPRLIPEEDKPVVEIKKETESKLSSTVLTATKPKGKIMIKPATTGTTLNNKTTTLLKTKTTSAKTSQLGSSLKKTTTTSVSNRLKPVETGSKGTSPSATSRNVTSKVPATRTLTTTTRPPSTTTTTTTTMKPKTTAEKSPIPNGHVKLSSKTTAKVPTTRKPLTTTIKPSVPKTNPIGTSLKPRVSSAPATKSPITKTTTRPLTATSTTAKAPRTIAPKSPMIDKQIKETANKQISLAKTNTTSLSPRTNVVGPKRVAGTNTKSLPIKKPSKSPLSKTTITKNLTTSSSTTPKVVQENGVTMNNPTDNKIEQDIPKKDLSPIDLTISNNQLITNAD